MECLRLVAFLDDFEVFFLMSEASFLSPKKLSRRRRRGEGGALLLPVWVLPSIECLRRLVGSLQQLVDEQLSALDFL